MVARRKVSRKLPLEWVAKWDVLTTKAVINTETLDMDLLPDEIAEIWQIDSYLVLDGVAVAGVDDESAINTYLSMDPDADDDPTVASHLADLEVFFSHFMTISSILDGTAASFESEKTSDQKTWRAVDGKPILVGTNVGMVGEWNTSADLFTNAQWQVRLYFTRRRATVSELNQILLKRR